MKKLLLLLLLSSPCLASGPKYTFQDPKMNDELNNVYHDIQNVNKGTVRVGVTSATLVDAVGLRATGVGLAAGGAGLEIIYSGGATGALIQSYDRTNAVYKPVQLIGVPVLLTSGSGSTYVSAQASGVSFLGTNTNDNAVAGNVGQYVEAVVTGVNLPASGALGDATSISLTAGDWDVSAAGAFNLSGATSASGNDFDIGISVNSGNNSAGLVFGDTEGWVPMTTTTIVFGIVSIPPKRFSLGSTTIIYLKMRGNYSAGTPTIQGARLSARRMR